MRAPGGTRSAEASLSRTGDALMIKAATSLRTRKTQVSRTSGALVAVRRRRQSAHPEPLDAPRIGVEHFKLEAVRMRDDLAALRHASGQSENEPAQRIDRFLFAFLPQTGAVLFFEGVDRDARIGDDA